MFASSKSYHAQLYLRRKLNEIHTALYDPSQAQVAPPLWSRQSVDFSSYLQDALDIMKFMPPEFACDPDEPFAKDILSARLRAKYWGAQVITFRQLPGRAHRSGVRSRRRQRGRNKPLAQICDKRDPGPDREHEGIPRP